ncbi:uncharacterized protein E0L32_002245 [Thyridium curvatum]|uniref:Uncharacterized protein n=1 Tax=Thyridium curvatum TaxID=1093900 RepID=A0A507APJ5_9PEZI|nr:uncharacterized protein E0L32_002245 [Thyridium curvatum]TPX06749.1 hypothetical protein E0L32_002245 [Thyridium curvatum]
MSWMDSWSRPSKHQATPAPYYLLPGGDSTPYCRTCGRAIGSRKADKSSSGGSNGGAAAAAARYCSARCRSNKPGRLDREIEAAFVRFLEGKEELPPTTSIEATGETPGVEGRSKKKKKKGPSGKPAKGDRRTLVLCDAVQAYMFNKHEDAPTPASSSAPTPEDHHPDTNTDSHTDPAEPPSPSPPANPRDSAIDLLPPNLKPEDDFSPRSANRGPSPDAEHLARLSVRSGTRVRPPQAVSQVNGSVGGEKGRAERHGETDAMRARRLDGQREVREREKVRAAARRGVVFGFPVVNDDHTTDNNDDGGKRRKKCEAVMQGKVVEPSFAKGNWGVRWREEW